VIDHPLVIGVAGGSGSGKTTVVAAIVRRLGRDQVSVIQHDSYYRDRSSRSLEERVHLNYDHPDSLDTTLLAQHIKSLANGEAVRVPVYDFATHTRTSETVLLRPRRLVIVEGILILADEAIRTLLDVAVFVDTDADIRIIRRLERDMEKRGRTRESIVRQYLDSVRPMHLEFVEPSKIHAHVIVREGGHNEAAIEALIEHIQAALDKQVVPPD
jgi:uridine kinase